MTEKKDTFEFTPSLTVNQDIRWNHSLKRFEVKNSDRVREGYVNSNESGRLIYKVRNTKTCKVCKYQWSRTITENGIIIAWIYVSMFSKVKHILYIENDNP